MGRRRSRQRHATPTPTWVLTVLCICLRSPPDRATDGRAVEDCSHNVLFTHDHQPPRALPRTIGWTISIF